MLSTQISGKYSEHDTGIFELKTALEALNVEVKYPFNDRIIDVYQGIPITFSIKDGKSFYEVELDFFKSIKSTSFHTIHNKYIETVGYMGLSTSTETLYAILHNKPIFLRYSIISFSSTIKKEIADIIEKNINKMITFSMDISSSELEKLSFPVVYDLTIEEENIIVKNVLDLLNSYKAKDS